MMAAITAARKGADVVVLERMKRVGKKLLATGNGRCNLTNQHMDGHNFHSGQPEFIIPSLNQFGYLKTLKFFEQLGLVWRCEDQGRIFPVTGQAASVLDLLRYEMERLNVRVYCEAAVSRVTQKGDRFLVVCHDKQQYASLAVVLATGGRAAPNLGSNGSGYKLASQLGHAVTPVFPSIVQIRLEAQYLKRLKGVRFQGRVSLECHGKEIENHTGEILITDYGLSGLPILNLGRMVNQTINRSGNLVLKLDFFPEKSMDEMKTMLLKRFQNLHYKSTEAGLLGLIHKRLIPIICQEARLDPVKSCGEIKQPEVDRLIQQLKMWKMNVLGTKGWSEAQVTAGGVDVRDVNPETLESKKTKGCFFSGEILDVDGDCGGYNLQWAWASGYMAGMCAARQGA